MKTNWKEVGITFLIIILFVILVNLILHFILNIELSPIESFILGLFEGAIVTHLRRAKHFEIK